MYSSHLREGSLNRENASKRSKPVRHFLNSWLIGAGPTHCAKCHSWAGGPGFHIKAAALQGPCFRFWIPAPAVPESLLWLPSVIDHNVEEEIQPFPPKLPPSCLAGESFKGRSHVCWLLLLASHSPCVEFHHDVQASLKCLIFLLSFPDADSAGVRHHAWVYLFSFLLRCFLHSLALKLLSSYGSWSSQIVQQWFSSCGSWPFGVDWPFHRGHLSDILCIRYLHYNS